MAANFYGTSDTAAGTQQKVVTLTGSAPEELSTGLRVTVKFANAQDYDGKPTLKIGSLAAVQVGNGSKGMWDAGDVIDFVYDGTAFQATSAGAGGGGGSAVFMFYIDADGYLHVTYPESVRNAPEFYIDADGYLHAVYADE